MLKHGVGCTILSCNETKREQTSFEKYHPTDICVVYGPVAYGILGESCWLMDCVLGSVDANGESTFVPRKDVEGQYENVENPDINYQPQGLPHPPILPSWWDTSVMWQSSQRSPWRASSSYSVVYQPAASHVV